ncbi:MAG: hypothetical protein NVS1B14_07170 [Vulcanimicrobiaceae bacterium]
MQTLVVAGALAASGSLILAAGSARAAALLRLRVSLVERREKDFLAAALRFGRAAIDSSVAVLRESAATLHAFLPDADVVAFLESCGEEMRVSYTSGERARHFAGARCALERRSLLGMAVLSGRPAFLADGGTALVATDRAALALPLRIAGDLSVLYVSAAQNGALGDGEMVLRVVELAAPSLQLAREREADRMTATYDGLTGLLTPRALRTRLAEEIQRAMVRGTQLSVWFVDTANFKAVNDRFGHAAGDAVLQRMAQILTDHTRNGIDLAARNGGDEFCAVIMHVPKSEAILRAARFCTAVAASDFGVAAALSASIGVAAFPQDAHDAPALLELADGAMYHSKSNGRNGVSYRVSERFERFSP